ncbi:AraC family ligand binding domain-containing protein [Pseudomonas paraeruginosa]|uniref:AraC family transcriptional regulator n=1 Tax=Pseudomonas paraeruginosa TaxID=2994495 RepID=UPI003F939A95
MPARDFELLPAHLAGVEAVAAESLHRFPRHSHAQYGIGLVEAGAQKSLSGRGMVEAEAGDLITVNPGEVHDGSPLGGRARRWRMLYLEPALLAEACAGIDERSASPPEFTLPVLRAPRLAAVFRQAFTALTETLGDAQSLAIEESLVGLLAEIVVPSRQPPADIRIQPLRERIDDDPLAPQTLAELASIAGLSRYQVLRAFSRATGLTPYAYLLQRRLERARGLLGTDQPLADIALACGFADQSHLTRLFARLYGISPGRYARPRR